MSTISNQFTFTVKDDPACWSGASLTAFEGTVLLPLDRYAIEQLRLRFLNVVTTSPMPNKQARTVAQLAFDTEIGVALKKLIFVGDDVLASRVCERRRFLEIDAAMRPYAFLFEPSLTDLTEAGAIPEEYLTLLRAHLNSQYPRYRVCAIAALLCLAAAFFHPVG